MNFERAILFAAGGLVVGIRAIIRNRRSTVCRSLVSFIGLGICLALPVPAKGQTPSQEPDAFAAAVKEGIDAWNALGLADQNQSLPPLKEVEAAWFTQDPPLREIASADGLLVAGTRAGSLYYRGRLSENATILRRPSGSLRWTIEDALWSPDGRYLAAKSIDDRHVPKITLTGSQFGPGRAKQVPYSRIGQALPIVRVWIIDVATGRAVPVARNPAEPYINVVSWSADGKVLRVLTADRFQRRLRLKAVELRTGATRLLHVEPHPVSMTGVALLHGFSKSLRELNLVRFLPDGSFVWTSDRSGFKHLYLHDPSGRMLRPLTAGKMSGFIDQLLEVDAPNRRLFARATGFDAANPYRHKLVRIDLDDAEVVDLIEADHIPSARFLLDRKLIQVVKADFPDIVDIVELTDSGTVLRTIFKTDWSRVLAAGYVRPEVTFVPAADGKTQLRAVVEFPFGFDATKRYPVIHTIYAGQQVINTPLSPRNQGPWRNARMGNFIFVVVDGRATPGRGREFQNYDYGRFGAVQAADQVAALRALAAKRPYMDLRRVGVMGGSWGGYFGLRTLLKYPELYKAGVFFAGAFEMPRMRVSAEPFMGCSPKQCSKAYARASNMALIDKLRAPLMIIHGTADNDVPIEESLNLVTALKQHRKAHEIIKIDGWNHFVPNWPEFGPRTMAFFKKHLGGPE